MSDSWTTLLSRPALLLPHPDPYPFTKQLSKSQSHSSLRSKLKFAASRHQHPSSRSLVTQLVRRATTSSKPSSSNLGDRAPKLDPLSFPVIDLTAPSDEEDMEGLPRTRRAFSCSSSKAKGGLVNARRNPEADADTKPGHAAEYNESDDENDDGNDAEEGPSSNSKWFSHIPLIGGSRFRQLRTTGALQNPPYIPGDQLSSPSAHLQDAEPSLVHDMTEEFTPPQSINNTSSSPSNSNSSSSCSIILHARTTPAVAFSMIGLEVKTDTNNNNAKIAMTKVEQKGKELEMAIEGSSTPSDVALVTPLVPGETPSTSTSTSTSISASSACSGSPAPRDIADKDTMADAAPVSRSKSTLMRWKSKRWCKSKAQRQLDDDGGECKSDTQPAIPPSASTSTPTSSPSTLISRKPPTLIHKPKHKRTASLGDAAVSLLLGVEPHETRKGVHSDDDEPEDFEFSGKWNSKDTTTLQSNHHTSSSPVKRARFVILGSESDVDLPSSNPNSGRSSPLPPLRPAPPRFSSSPTSSPLASKVSSAEQLPVSQPQTQQTLLQPPSFFLASTSSSASSIQRPALLRRDAQAADSHEPVRRRRWTLASAMTDEAISDEGLLRELERMHELGAWNRELLSKEGERSTEGQSTPNDADSIWDVGREIWEGMSDRERTKKKRKKEGLDKDNEDEDNNQDDGEDDNVHDVSRSPSYSHPLLSTSSSSWLTAQRALLICRELIMTERHYHALLLSLLAGDTHTPPPSLMQHYAAELVQASGAVLRAMEEQPSALGVARAFVENVEEVEGAYVRWCGVVGGWFVAGAGAAGAGGGGGTGGGVEDPGGNAKLKRNRSRYRSSIDSAVPPVTAAADAPSYIGGVESEDGHTGSSSTTPPVSPLKRTVRTWRRSLPSVASLGEAGASIYGYGYGYGSRSLRRRNKDSKEVGKVAEEEEEEGVGVGRDLSPATTTTTSSSTSSSGQNLASRPPRVRGKPAVRDLAILPTQRVMRYVLLYRDLLSHTPPTSSSRVFVEKAVDAACRIADKCDRAQGNAAFILASTTTTNGSSPPPQSPAGTETTSHRSNSGRTTTTTGSSSADSTPPSSVEGERPREEEEEGEEQDKLGGSIDGCHVKLSSLSPMRRVSMSVSFMSSIGWGRS